MSEHTMNAQYFQIFPMRIKISVRFTTFISNEQFDMKGTISSNLRKYQIKMVRTALKYIQI